MSWVRQSVPSAKSDQDSFWNQAPRTRLCTWKKNPILPACGLCTSICGCGRVGVCSLALVVSRSEWKWYKEQNPAPVDIINIYIVLITWLNDPNLFMILPINWVQRLKDWLNCHAGAIEWHTREAQAFLDSLPTSPGIAAVSRSPLGHVMAYINKKWNRIYTYLYRVLLPIPNNTLKQPSPWQLGVGRIDISYWHNVIFWGAALFTLFVGHWNEITHLPSEYGHVANRNWAHT